MEARAELVVSNFFFQEGAKYLPGALQGPGRGSTAAA